MIKTTITIPYTDLYKLLDKKDSMKGIVDLFLSKRKDLQLTNEFTSINDGKYFLNFELEEKA